jgi:uncharacterized protein (DUF697 family)
MAKGTSSKLGMIGSVRNFVNVVREIDLDEVRANAEMAPRLLVLAPSEEDAEKLAELLVGTPRSPYVYAARLDAPPRTGHAFDAVVAFDPSEADPIPRVAEALRARELQLPIVAFGGRDVSDEAAAEMAREAIVVRALERAPAFGRHIPAFRPAAVKAVVDETARANAQFALVSNIPSIIPVIGSLMAAGTDMLVLTKNQVMMIYKIAAIHDRDLHDQRKILGEVAPVVGAGFFWRTLAREAASFLPLLIGTLPKVGVAYVGTVVAGRAADFFYRYGQKPNKQQMREIYQQATDALKRVPLLLPGRSGSNGA